MPEYLAPGVYVEETSFRARSIQGVGTSTTGFVGPARKGPPSNGDNGFVPEVLTSFADFERVYGGLGDLDMRRGEGDPATNYVAYAVRGFFFEGGTRLYFARVHQPRPGDGDGRASAPIRPEPEADPIAAFRARYAGSALNGTVNASELLQPAAERAVETAPVGTLARNLARPSQPARLDATRAPRPLDDGAVLRLVIGGGDAVEVSFQGTPARARADAALADPLDIPADTELAVRVDGERQVIGLPQGEVAAEDFVTQLNDDLGRASARLEGGQLVIETDHRGRTATIEVEPIDLLGFPEDNPDRIGQGGGNVDDMDRVTAADLNRRFEELGIEDQVRATTLPGTNFLRLVTAAAGAEASLEAEETPARDALGFPAGAAEGEAGAAREYLAREADGWHGYTFEADAWTRADDTTAPDEIGEDSHALVTLKLEILDADGNSLPYEGLGFAGAHPLYVGRVLDPNATRRAEILDHPIAFEMEDNNPAALHAALFRDGRADAGGAFQATLRLTGGDDGTLASVQAYQEAFERLRTIDDIAIVAAPGHSAYAGIRDAVRNTLVRHAEQSRFRIAVVDGPPGQTPGEVRTLPGRISSSYAALYWPWLVTTNPLWRPGREDIPRELVLPPSGHICGIYARNDTLRGAWKSPANEVVREALRFEREVSHGEQEVLNPLGVNCLRYFVGRGFRVWGARLATTDREVVYVSDRRYLNYLKRSIDVSTQWAVFEPNGPRLWSNIRDTVWNFLYAEWRGGALLGATEDQAFFVRCDRSTMTQADLDNGRLICEIGVALIKPAEFVIFRIGQKTADARG